MSDSDEAVAATRSLVSASATLPTSALRATLASATVVHVDQLVEFESQSRSGQAILRFPSSSKAAAQLARPLVFPADADAAAGGVGQARVPTAGAAADPATAAASSGGGGGGGDPVVAASSSSSSSSSFVSLLVDWYDAHVCGDSADCEHEWVLSTTHSTSPVVLFRFGPDWQVENARHLHAWLREMNALPMNYIPHGARPGVAADEVAAANRLLPPEHQPDRSLVWPVHDPYESNPQPRVPAEEPLTNGTDACLAAFVMAIFLALDSNASKRSCRHRPDDVMDTIIDQTYCGEPQ